MEKNKLLVIIIIIIFVAALGYGGYTLFSKNNGGEATPTASPDTKKPVLERVVLSETEQVKNNIRIKMADDTIYINDNIVTGISTKYAYITDNLILFTDDGNCGEVLTYVTDTSGVGLGFENNQFQIQKFFLNDEGVVSASVKIVCECSEEEVCAEFNVRVTSDGKVIKLVA